MLYALPDHFLEQSAEYLPERGLTPTQLGDCAVVRNPVEQVKAQIPPQGPVRIDVLRYLTF